MDVDKSPERIRRMFGEIAGRYDLLNHLLSFQVDRYWRWRTVRRVRPVGGGPVLDVCTGTGDLALAYRRHDRSGVRVVGADFCHPMLVRGLAKSRAADGDLPVDFIEADATRLPFASDVFEVVSVAFGIRNVADCGRGIGEMVRVCRRGGQVAVLEFSAPERQPMRSLYGWYLRWVLPRLGQWISGSRQKAYDYLPASVAEFPAGETFAALMRRAGLSNVVIVPLTFGIATLYVGTKKQ
jgi:demethylmenaquinone methyltransferase/2-methoxy-6-polyprenyl-1,4-benzoquinol methylase